MVWLSRVVVGRRVVDVREVFPVEVGDVALSRVVTVREVFPVEIADVALGRVVWRVELEVERVEEDGDVALLTCVAVVNATRVRVEFDVEVVSLAVPRKPPARVGAAAVLDEVSFATTNTRTPSSTTVAFPSNTASVSKGEVVLEVVVKLRGTACSSVGSRDTKTRTSQDFVAIACLSPQPRALEVSGDNPHDREGEGGGRESEGD